MLRHNLSHKFRHKFRDALNFWLKLRSASDVEAWLSEPKTLYARKNRSTHPLAKKPLPVQSICLVVPAYRELKNGNIKNFLQSLLQQEGDLSKLKIMFVVNNSEQIAQDPNSEILLENQETLRYLKQVAQAGEYPFQIHSLDLSSHGTERNMGKIRQQGIAALSKTLSGPEQQHILVHMDSDTRFAPGFFKRLEFLYSQHADLEAVFFRREYELRGTPEGKMLASHPVFVMKRTIRDLKVILSSFEEGFATYQMSSRFSTMSSIGGFKPLAAHEDTQLSLDLLKRVYLMDPELLVKTEDRSRPDGFTGAIRYQDLSANKKEERAWPLVKTLFENVSVRLTDQVQSGQMTFAQALTCFATVASYVLKKKVPEPQINSLPFMKGIETPAALVNLSGYKGDFLINPVAGANVDFYFQKSTRIGQDIFDIVVRHLDGREKDLLFYFLNTSKRSLKKTSTTTQCNYIRVVNDFLILALAYPEQFPQTKILLNQLLSTTCG